MNINYVDISNHRLVRIGHSFDSAQKHTKLTVTTGIDKNDAAVMDISRVGQLKAQRILQRENMNDIQKDIQEDKIFEGETVKTVEGIMEAVRNGVPISMEEQDMLDEHLSEILRLKYEDMKELRLSGYAEEVLKELKNNYVMKQRTLQDLAKQIEEQKLEEQEKETGAEQTQKMQEVSTKKAEVEMIEDSLGKEDDEEKEAASLDEDEKAVTMSSGEKTQEVPETTEDIKKTLEYMQKNDENMKALQEKKEQEVITEKEFDVALDQAYIRTKNFFEDEGTTIAQRVLAYDQFAADAKELAINREIARNKKMYDYEAMVDIKLAALNNKNISLAEIMLGKRDKATTGQEFVNKTL